MEETLDRYLSKIRKVYPHLEIKAATLNQEGLVNDVVIVNNARVFRFGKHEWANDDLRQEYNCLTLARQYTEMRLPDWSWHGEDFISYEMIPGVPLQRHHIFEAEERDQEALARQLGTFLHRLHTIPMSEVRAHDVRKSATYRPRERWLQLYEEVKEELFPYLMTYSRQWVDHHFEPLLKDTAFMDGSETFMNGDLTSYHLLYDPRTKRLNGVIDFGTAGVGDPACDLALIVDQYGEQFLRRIDTYYPGIERRIERARFWAGTLELQWLLGGLRNPHDLSWFAVHIGRARDVMPIGSGW